MRAPGRVLSREQILNGVWGQGVYIDERTVDVHVGRLRRDLEAHAHGNPIRTVRGFGYALEEGSHPVDRQGHTRKATVEEAGQDFTRG